MRKCNHLYIVSQICLLLERCWHAVLPRSPARQAVEYVERIRGSKLANHIEGLTKKGWRELREVQKGKQVKYPSNEKVGIWIGHVVVT